MNFNRHRVLTHGISLADFSLALTAPADPSGPRIKSPEALPKDFRKTEEGVRRTAPVSTARLHWHRPCKDTLGPHGVLWSPLGGSSRSQNRFAERCCPRSLVSGTSGSVCCWGQDVSEPQVLHVCHGFLLCLGLQPRSTVLSSHQVSANPGPVTITVPLCPYLLCELGVYRKGCGILLTGICYHVKVTFHVTIWFDAVWGACSPAGVYFTCFYTKLLPSSHSATD